MFKKISIITLIVIILGSAIYSICYIRNQRFPSFEITRAIPIDAIFITESSGILDKLVLMQKDNEIWKELKQLPGFSQFDSDISFLTTWAAKNQLVFDLINQNKILISAHKSGNSNLGFLYFIHLNNVRDKKVILELINQQIQAKETIEKRNYNNTEIFSVNVKNRANKKLHFSFYRGILIASSSPVLVESALKQADAGESLANDPGFTRVSKTAGKNVDAALYINFHHLPQAVSLALNREYMQQVLNFTNFGNWAELDLSIKKDAILLNGFTFSNEVLNNYLNIFLKQDAIDHQMNKILPSNTSVFASFGISNNELYLKSYKKYLEKSGKINSYRFVIDKYINHYAIDLEKEFFNIIDQEIGIAFTEIEDTNLYENSFIVMRVKAKSLAQNSVESMLTRISEVDNVKKANYIQKLKIDKETVYTIYSFPVKNIFETFFGSIFSGIENKYCTFIDNYIVFSDSKNALSKFVHANILKKTLDTDVKFGRFSEYLSSKSNFYFYANMFRSPLFISNYLNDSLQLGLNKNIESFKKFQAFAIQFSKSNNMIYNNLFLKYIPDSKAEAITVWESHLDTVIDFKPCLVTNHYSKENEVFVQDVNNKIYLINKVGRILWRIQLNEKINSNIYQVDFYKNGKLQLLFSTESQIHLIDRNGNYVERYPVKLRSKATAGLSIFDYEKNLDYRLFIPCTNKNIYAYDIRGNLVNGWAFEQSDNLISTPPEHFKVNTNDYIVFADKFRMYILNRRGEERLRIKNQFMKSKNNKFFLDTGTEKERLITTDTSGTIKLIYFNGSVEEKQIRKFSSNHFFDFQDIDADGLKDYIFLDNKSLEIYNQEGKTIFTYNFSNPITDPPLYYYFSYDDRKIGIVSRDTNEIFLINNDGTIYNGFPLNGSTLFTIGFLGNSGSQFNLVVGSKSNFLYNYSVN
ncbi:MAG: hypothetical protein A2X13_07750 [Bacteroidetes bacterium GWC2_33_15]|nr:MAG: hypothetical protein A2X10_04805 [Bacteroidetes bacterium GWA2_33_15]OFX52645.1 MAG: hypothetical protein A2X13_07750 [Bacteroidetes bacterium GWC2_33_15]OFX64049.1 MAG: hypothetical protein A2X15_02585 [Bacteroidetes bacterium GWB2_32_14]OFX67266.1 MAG: hypothetical protein A2X14_11830 [Bacteroidetes bacterium GWD2_33_33]HAN18875.1 hypothetical protein [Bacteroidales bacterium]